jgi:predicted tellurium resistance membrane protein TerC
VILTGGMLGIVAMRFVIGRLLSLIERYPPLVDGAFVIISWVALKLLVEFLHNQEYIRLQIPNWISLGMIVAIFVSAFLYARRQEQHARRSGSHRASQLWDREP